MRVSFDQNYLFTTGVDGVFCIFEIKDKDPKFKKEKEQVQIPDSTEILIQKSERDKIQQDIINARSMLETFKQNAQNEGQKQIDQKNAKIEAI